MGNSSVKKCPEPLAMPIIFVPGIMGSRLRRSSDRKIFWDPEDDLWNALGLAQRGPEGKRRMIIGPNGAAFNPNYLEVDPGKVESEKGQGGSLPPLERLERGWGGLFQKSYFGFANWLQNNAGTAVGGQVPEGCSNVHYEVWAHPYNWTDHNLSSGKKLGDTVDKAIAATLTKYQETGIWTLLFTTRVDC